MRTRDTEDSTDTMELKAELQALQLKQRSTIKSLEGIHLSINRIAVKLGKTSNIITSDLVKTEDTHTTPKTLPTKQRYVLKTFTSRSRSPKRSRKIIK